MHDGVETYKSYPLGQKSIDLTQTGYEKFVSPFIPYAKGPYAHIAPIVNKADSIGYKGLTKVDSTFPIVTKDTATIKNTILDFAYFPFRLANDGKNYLLETYSGEYKKCGGENAPYTSSGKAVVTTGIIVTSDVLAWASEFLSARKAQSEDFASNKYQQGSEYAKSQYEYVNGKKDEYVNYASEKAEQAKNLAYAKKEEAEKQDSDAKMHAHQKSSK